MENKMNLLIFTLIVFIAVNQISIWGLQTQNQNRNQIILSQSDLIYKLAREVNIIKNEIK